MKKNIYESPACRFEIFEVCGVLQHTSTNPGGKNVMDGNPDGAPARRMKI
ncbi:MAG: hypothetical protein II970_08880 [Paludibacteraceae bacterium]|nr:hypothetical protein [Paludibacteraceae bacterium]